MPNSLNGYIGFYNGHTAETYAPTLYAAKLLLIEALSIPARKEHLLSVHLAEKKGEPVTHTPDF